MNQTIEEKIESMSKTGGIPMNIRGITNPYLIITHICRHWPFRCVSDKFYLKVFFRAHQGYSLNLINPKSYNEKLQWLKLYDRKEEYTQLSDKYLVRDYVKEKIGEDYLVPLLGVWDSVKDINISNMPDQFVLKCNHDSGSVIICKDKSSFNSRKAFHKLSKGMKHNYFWKSREYNYFGIKRKIIAEEYISDRYSEELTDYKFFCFDGVPRFVQVDTGRFTDHVRNFYDTNWNYIDVSYGCKNSSSAMMQRPFFLDEMLMLAQRLSEGIPHVRVDFYYSCGKVFFGELTFHHGGGVMKVEPFDYDLKWGGFLDIEKIKRENKA